MKGFGHITRFHCHFRNYGINYWTFVDEKLPPQKFKWSLIQNLQAYLGTLEMYDSLLTNLKTFFMANNHISNKSLEMRCQRYLVDNTTLFLDQKKYSHF